MEIFAGRKRIASKVVLCDNLLTQAKGLMFRSTPLKRGEAYFFTIGGPIHMAFVHFPIDVVWLDSSMRIVDVQTATPARLLDFGSWKAYYPKSESGFVLELPAGISSCLKIGQKLTIKA